VGGELEITGVQFGREKRRGSRLSVSHNSQKPLLKLTNCWGTYDKPVHLKRIGKEHAASPCLLCSTE